MEATPPKGPTPYGGHQSQVTEGIHWRYVTESSHQRYVTEGIAIYVDPYVMDL